MTGRSRPPGRREARWIRFSTVQYRWIATGNQFTAGAIAAPRPPPARLGESRRHPHGPDACAHATLLNLFGNREMAGYPVPGARRAKSQPSVEVEVEWHQQ